MAEYADFLVEIGTEELPPGSLGALAGAFADGLSAALGELELAVGDDAVRWYASPRRLAVLVRDLPLAQPDREEQRLGPALAAAFDPSGAPTRAAQGFAASCGVSVEELERIATPKGERLGFLRQIAGRPASELLPGAVEQGLRRLPVPRPMRWGDNDFAFVRPVHWVVALLGDAVVPGTLLGQPIGRESRGHRFHHGSTVSIPRPDAYEALLLEAHVIVDQDARRERVRTAVEETAAAAGGRAVVRPALLEEVTNLVEWPVPVLGEFEEAFLEVPSEALISSMEGHQKFFPLVDEAGGLLPRFVGVSNIDSREPAEVARGYARVIRPRLADARFFWDRDRKVALEDHRKALRTMVYQKDLGSIDERSLRIKTLARRIAAQLGEDPAAVSRAAELAKCDLMTAMVGEFPELQGIMGRYLALEQGEGEAVAWAIEEHYQPAHAGEALPTRPASRILAIADRVDTLAGIFAVGLRPTGNKDPYALRRAALGLGRLLIEGELDLDLQDLVSAALAPIGERVADAGAQADAVVDFVFERLRAWYAELDVDTETFNAVLAVRPTRPIDFDRRVRACRAFGRLEAAAALAAANKRIGNILRKHPDPVTPGIDRERLTEPTELELADAVEAARAAIEPLVTAGAYAPALERLAELRPLVDRFFDEILVMAEDPAVREARLALLGRLKGLFDGIADISVLARAR